MKKIAYKSGFDFAVTIVQSIESNGDAVLLERNARDHFILLRNRGGVSTFDDAIAGEGGSEIEAALEAGFEAGLREEIPRRIKAFLNE